MELTFREKMSLTSIRDQAKAHELRSSDLGPECATLHGKGNSREHDGCQKNILKTFVITILDKPC